MNLCYFRLRLTVCNFLNNSPQLRDYLHSHRRFSLEVGLSVCGSRCHFHIDHLMANKPRLPILQLCSQLKHFTCKISYTLINSVVPGRALDLSIGTTQYFYKCLSSPVLYLYPKAPFAFSVLFPTPNFR